MISGPFDQFQQGKIMFHHSLTTSLATVLERQKFGPEFVFNIDETGVTVQRPRECLLRQKDNKLRSWLASQERAWTVDYCRLRSDSSSDHISADELQKPLCAGWSSTWATRT